VSISLRHSERRRDSSPNINVAVPTSIIPVVLMVMVQGLKIAAVDVAVVVVVVVVVKRARPIHVGGCFGSVQLGCRG